MKAAVALVLGIETSCDETAAAVLRAPGTILSSVVHSQVALHARHHGVVPEIASRSHTTRILPVVRAALDQARVAPDQLAAVAVTHRPGMIGCLLVGMAAAQALAWRFHLPLAGVDHIRAHIHAAWMVRPDLPPPCLALIASGGHTALWAGDDALRAVRLGTTRDDAAGEALDKGAALLGLSYPGGPAIEAAARGGDPRALDLPRPLLERGSLDFSFSGIKTALLYALRGNGLTRPMPRLSEAEVKDLAASYQAAVIDVLVEKLRRAARAHAFRSLAIGGGVARNALLRQRLAADRELSGLELVLPPPELCSDNAAMVAGLGLLQWQRGQVAGLDLEPVATTRSDA